MLEEFMKNVMEGNLSYEITPEDLISIGMAKDLSRAYEIINNLISEGLLRHKTSLSITDVYELTDKAKRYVEGKKGIVLERVKVLRFLKEEISRLQLMMLVSAPEARHLVAEELVDIVNRMDTRLSRVLGSREYTMVVDALRNFEAQLSEYAKHSDRVVWDNVVSSYTRLMSIINKILSGRVSEMMKEKEKIYETIIKNIPPSGITIDTLITKLRTYGIDLTREDIRFYVDLMISEGKLLTDGRKVWAVKHEEGTEKSGEVSGRKRRKSEMEGT